jgi:hypothetical protein
MNANAEQIRRRLLAAVFTLIALLALIAAMAQMRTSANPTAQSAPAFTVVKMPGGGQRVVQLQPAHATTQSSPGGQRQLVSVAGRNGSPVVISQPAGGSDR